MGIIHVMTRHKNTHITVFESSFHLESSFAATFDKFHTHQFSTDSRHVVLCQVVEAFR